MSQADDLLATLSVDYTDEAYIYVNDDRTITVPDELKHIAVQGDHNIETVTFDGPRYWDGHDFSKMKVRINYMRADGFKDSYLTKNQRISEEDDTRILFDWTISGNVTAVVGKLSFLVYIESTSADPCWHSRLNQQMVVDEGLSAAEQIIRAPDSIEAILAQTTASYIAEAKADIEGKTAQSLASIPEDYTTVNNMAEEALREKSNVVKMEAEGEAIVAHDSADNALLGLKIFGKSTQVITTGKQLLDFTTGITASGVTANFVNDTLIVVGDGSLPYQSWSRDITGLVKGHSGEILSISYDALKTAKDHDGSIIQLNIANNDGTNTYYQLVSISGYKKTYTIPTDTSVFKSVHLAVYTTNNSSSKANTVTMVKPVLHYGRETPAYEPYSGRVASPSVEWPQPIMSVGTEKSVTVSLAGANLFDVWNAAPRTSNGLTSVVNADGSVTVSGTPTAKYAQAYSGTIKLPKGKYYVSGGENATGCVYFQLYANKYDGSQKYAINDVFEVDGSENGDIHYSIQAGVDLDPISNYTLYPMFNIGETRMNFEPYRSGGEVSITRDIPGIPVVSGGNYTDSDGQQWVCDEIDFERGMYVQRIYDMVFTGNETISRENNSTWSEGCYVVYTGKDHPNHVHGECMCTFLPAHSNADLADGKFECGIGTHGQPNLLVRFSKAINTLESFRTAWSSAISAGGKVYCILATPIETPLSDAELASFKMVRTNYPSTTVLNDSGAHMAIKYAGDTKTYVDNSLRNSTLVDTATGKLYRLAVTNGQLTVVAV